MGEIWKDISGYEGKYAISSYGNIIALNYNREKRAQNRIPRKDKGGYLYVNLWKNGISKTFKIHRLVAEAFLPNPNNLPQINHKDENKTNNSVFNLEWCSPSYNSKYGNHSRKVLDSHKKNNSPKAEKSVAKCSKDGDILDIYISISEAARQTGINRECIRDTCIGKQKTCRGYIWRYYNN